MQPYKSNQCTAYLLPKKFNVSLIDLVSQLASQLQFQIAIASIC